MIDDKIKKEEKKKEEERVSYKWFKCEEKMHMKPREKILLLVREVFSNLSECVSLVELC